MFLNCPLKDGKEVNAVMLAGTLFHTRATITRNCGKNVRIMECQGGLAMRKVSCLSFCPTQAL